MKPRSLLLFFLAVIFFTIAPAAMATNCKRCVDIDGSCINAFHVDGFTICYVDATGCHLDGVQCAPAGAETALASEYSVVSVERRDDQKPIVDDAPALVAPAETEVPHSR
jgi:hypothetical protein